MRLLLMNQFFPPDAAPTGELLADLAERLAAGGYEVQILCARSSYAPASGRRVEQVCVRRAEGIAFNRGLAGRISSYLSFLSLAMWHGLTGPRPDVVVTMSTPPLLGLVGWVIQVFRGSKHVMWEMDLYPDVAAGLGVLREGAPWTRALAALADACRQKAAAVIVLGECMRRRLEAHGLPGEKIVVADNWADANLIRPVRRERDGTLHVLYAGNLGLPHDVETIQRVMEEVQEDGRFRFTFSGGGSRRRELEEFCRGRGLRNVEFLSYCRREDQAELLARGDLGLVTQLPGSLGCLVPSKIYSLMAAGRPVLFIGPREAHAAQVVLRHGCGWQVECGNWPEAVSILRELAGRPDLLEAAGQRAREASIRFYDKPQGTARVWQVIERVVGVEAPSPAAV